MSKRRHEAMRKTWSWSACGYVFVGMEVCFERIFEVCRDAGFAGIEGAAPLFEGMSEGELERTATVFRNAGVQIETFHLPFGPANDLACFYETRRREAVQTAAFWIERAALLGASVCVQHPTTDHSETDVEGVDPYLRQLGKSLEVLLPAAERLGVCIAMENMLPLGGSHFGSRTEHFRRMLKEFEHASFGFCLDTGHALVAGGPDGAPAFLETMRPHLQAFHLSDTAGDRDIHVAPGHGLVDWRSVFRGMAELSFDKPACIETAPFAHGPDYSTEAWRTLVQETEQLVRGSFEAEISSGIGTSLQ